MGHKDNHHKQYLESQLEIAQQELSLIKSSRGYRLIRSVGYAKNQLKQAPLKFPAKVAKKILKPNKQYVTQITNNIISTEDLQTQYKQWIIFNEPDQTELDIQKRLADNFPQKPIISIVTPVFNPPLEILRSLIESVLNQTYPYFELCLGNFGTSPDVDALIKEYCAKDKRIKTWTFPNKGIATNSNEILKEAVGDYIALLDHDDTLSPDALFENAKMINQADYDFIYSDKDKIDEAGHRFEPFFKPDWSPEVMLNANYLTHLNVMKTSLVTKVGGWSSDTDGAQDWDLFFKVIEVSKLVGHIPKVLYHWRVISTSTAMSIDTKPYALEGQRRAVDKYMADRGINATSYHVGAELLLKWSKASNDPLVIVYSSSYASLLRFLSQLITASKDPEVNHFHYAVLMDYTVQIDAGMCPDNVKFISYKHGNYALALKELLKNSSKKNVVIVDDRINPTSLLNTPIEELTGWLDIKGVKAVSPRVVEPNSKTAIDCGAFITRKGIKPIFEGSVPYHQTPIGNIEWVRDLTVLSHVYFLSKPTDLVEALDFVVKFHCDDRYVHTALQLRLAKDGRLVFNPKVYIELAPDSQIDQEDYYNSASVLLEKLFPKDDPYNNPNLSVDNPMRLATIDQTEDVDEMGDFPPTAYQEEARSHAFNISLSHQEMQANLQHITQSNKQSITIHHVLFILPGFDAIYAGLNNIFSYAIFLRERGIKISMALILEKKDLQRHIEIVAEKFPELAQSINFLAVTFDSADSLPSSDVAICTQWATAYILAKYNKTKRKCYFIQDKEASFYPKGTISALVETTYTLHFFALANTPGLLKWYEQDYEGQGVIIKSKLALSGYSPDPNKQFQTQKPYKVFFYGRPNEPRNAFELGIAALERLKQKLKDDVEIYSAGAVWDPAEYGLEGSIISLGKIAYDKLPAFYRSMDIGMMFMFSGHPGVVASELMASGCPVVVNQYRDETWNKLYEHEKDCIVSIPNASSIAENLERGLTDVQLRQTIIPNAVKKVAEFYGHYDESCEASVAALQKNIQD